MEDPVEDPKEGPEENAEEDPEIVAISTVFNALKGLEKSTVGRILRWTAEKYGVDATNTIAQTAIDIKKPVGTTVESTEEQSKEQTSNYDTFADFFDATSPKTTEDKALVAAYWVQVHDKIKPWQSRLLTPILKDLGHSIPNITSALTSNINKKPQLVLQVSKIGRSRQSTKKYKVTQAGLTRVEKMLDEESAEG